MLWEHEVVGSNPTTPVWRNLAARVLWEHEVVGSNPTTPTTIRRGDANADCGRVGDFTHGTPRLNRSRARWSRKVEPMRLLLMEDDDRLAGLLARGLRAEGHAVDRAGTIEDGRWLATENPYDVLIFDVMLPDGDGFGLCSELRAGGTWTPVLMLTARDAVADRVRGLDVGADDYLVKPFAFPELTARLRALARRGAAERPAILRVGSLTLDPAGRTVSIGDEPLDLTAREYAILELFVRRTGDVLTRTEILERVWDWAYDGTSNVIDVFVRSLRGKLAKHPAAPSIETVRGIGYVLRPEPGRVGLRTAIVTRHRLGRDERGSEDQASGRHAAPG